MLSHTNRSHHFWDYTNAKSASLSTAQAKARKGWKLHKVSQGYGAAGGVASFEYALVGPDGELLKVSTRIVAEAGLSVEPAMLELGMQVVLLENVVKTQLFAETVRRGLKCISELGAYWSAEYRSWMVRPDAVANFPAWMFADQQPVPMFPLLKAA